MILVPLPMKERQAKAINQITTIFGSLFLIDCFSDRVLLLLKDEYEEEEEEKDKHPLFPLIPSLSSSVLPSLLCDADFEKEGRQAVNRR